MNVVAMPTEAIKAGPSVNWNHTDGPLLSWAGNLHWLTLRERLRIWLGWTTVKAVAEARFPWLARV